MESGGPSWPLHASFQQHGCSRMVAQDAASLLSFGKSF